MAKRNSTPDQLHEFVQVVDALVESSIMFKGPASVLAEAAAGHTPDNYHDCVLRAWEYQQKHDEARAKILTLTPLLVAELGGDSREVLTIAQAAEAVNRDGADTIAEQWPELKVSLQVLEARLRAAGAKTPRYDHAVLTEPRAPRQWAKLFNMTWDTLKLRFEDGSIRNVRLSSKSYRVHVDDMPAVTKFG